MIGTRNVTRWLRRLPNLELPLKGILLYILRTTGSAQIATRVSRYAGQAGLPMILIPENEDINPPAHLRAGRPFFPHLRKGGAFGSLQVIHSGSIPLRLPLTLLARAASSRVM